MTPPVIAHSSFQDSIQRVMSVLSQGKDMLMVLENDTMNLIDPLGQTLLHAQPIASIRVWGVGRDNGRSVFDRIRQSRAKLRPGTVRPSSSMYVLW